MTHPLIDIQVDLAQLKTAFGNSLRVGPIEAVDPRKGYRINEGMGSDGKPKLSPWYPHPESGGKTSTWAPLSKGQIVGVLNPNGNPRQGVLLRGGFSDLNPPSSQSLAQNRYVFAGVRITVENGVVTIDGDIRVNGRLHATDGLRGDAGVYSEVGVFPPAPVHVDEVSA
jgi:phage baseplate assembly protein gpV